MDQYTRNRDRSKWKIGCIVTIVVVLVIVGMMASFFIGQYNKTVRLDEEVKQGWSEVENQLKRRYDLIPNLVETVKGYAKHEKEVFTRLADARKGYFSAKTVGEKAAASGTLERALSRLMMLRENYPNLKANQNFMKLQDSLEGTENRIAVARTRYNEAVKLLNAYVRSFFGRFFAGLTGVTKAEFFEIPDEQKQEMDRAPEVKL